MGGRSLCTGLLGLIAALLAAGAAHAVAPPTGWDGTNPFACELQQAGLEATGPDPGADPYCVEFDKRHQNVTELGVVDFLSKEPARVAAAGPKCFYFQSDHWRGSIVQADGSTKTYEWDGHYFFDKARGEGGVWVTNFNVNGRTEDPGRVPGMPPEYARYFGPGTGGFITRNEVPVDASCVAKAERPEAIYASGRPGAGATPRGCFTPSGGAGARRLGRIALGESERRVRELLGPPVRVKRGFLRYCQQGAGKFLVGIPGDRSGDLGAGADEPAVFLLTTNASYRLRGVGRGSSAHALRRAFPRAQRLLVMARTAVYAIRPGSGVLVGVRRGAVRFVAVRDTARIRTRGALAAWLRRAQ